MLQSLGKKDLLKKVAKKSYLKVLEIFDTNPKKLNIKLKEVKFLGDT